MKVIIAGSRNITDAVFVREIVRKGMQSFKDADPSLELRGCEVVSGTARGIDRIGEAIALHCATCPHPITKFPADWNKHGKKAGYLRNKQMAEYATHLIAIWDGKSSGTKSMIDLAREKGLKVFVHNMEDENGPRPR